MPRSRFIEFLLLCGLFIAFLDESVRKVMPEQPIYVTAVKDFLFLLAGMLALVRFPQFHRHVLLFVPWVLYTLASAVMVTMTYDTYLLPAAIVRTYASAPLLLACGLYLGSTPVALRRAAIVFVIGASAAVLVTFLQETMRDALPGALSVRIYSDRHSLAGGNFNESLFASPQILAQVAVAFFALLVTAMLVTDRPLRVAVLLPVLAAALLTVYLSRIRTGLLVAALVAALVALLLVLRSGVGLGRVLRRLGAVAVVCVAAGSVLAALTDDPYRARDLERDKNFFLHLLNPAELTQRLLFFVHEIEGWPDHDALTGYGAGTGGLTRSVIGETEVLAVPRIHDSGIALIYHELGLLGVATFALGYLGTLLRTSLRAAAGPGLPPEAAPTLAVAAGFTVWFLFKSHPVIANGCSHFLWLACLGIATAAVDRSRQPAAQPQDPYDPAYALPGYYPYA